MKRRLKILNRARRDIPEAIDWWKANRPKAPRALNEELRRAFRIIYEQPNAGLVAKDSDLKGLRRIYLSRVRYHLYYRFTESKNLVEVMTLWHASRGSGPGLK